MLTQAPKGTKDILPSEVYKWHYIEKEIAKLCHDFGYKEIRIPVFEHTELFQRGVGDTTDIVQKEMYTFLDKGQRSITLRPEGTAGVVRSYIENGMASLPQPVKLYYNITAYRYENVQKGRYREFHQFGVEAFGAPGPSIDVEIISMVKLFFDRLGIKEISLNINSIGCPVCRAEYNKKLMDYLRPNLSKLCATCNTRFERNPLRIIDCKEESCKKITANAPALVENLCDDCKNHFEGLKAGLENLGIDYKIDKNIVRGLDYYTKTVFEFVSDNIGAQGTVCGGGRYDGLVEACGGKPTPGIGFAMGLERLLMVMENQGIKFPESKKPDIFIAAIGDKANSYAEKMVYELRKEGLSAEKDLMGKSLKAQMKYADKLGAKYSIALGDDEIESGKAVLKNMETGEQKEISLDTLISRLKM
ncbi:MAG TPA: histidine--tRNA ligase [Hungateiclostridium thermocellum]|jgi:histidyl-tRNA synthetase|uniref:Histidine--tRNA ligase n=2 Tax=Acetivibrio thermocellus TaxID=1515 RepID=SYH_ACET2|nr:histidine--tRNA ligase [Acetivibrio thermocellus]A3DF35.1 RecName: Full=Histidine--tRNA ligase; AltName: Full=Histidyl-tRNA synthetase; Short=HisRS [Acetivibrio thermocellus ATCC 27405]CDG36006.1 Histidine-tRNA ligase [Acetivibrio thermocellus BC1]ABN52564.1 histidyl-tRNA synthetase [Acetivibrio thermocellus ATCC 27405]ADU73990.1 histidyl-tRNA synthetase [Acetivibrio thermocellus DSM 1313]ALX07928.1 Histidyl-tRNA synthetase [Acetivibrio thermocellus AD2]ANV75674.1 Histidyl-tRNA synthetase 